MAIRDMTPTHAAFVTVSDGSTSRSTAKADFMSSDPYISIQEAIDFIEANYIDGGVVWVRAGTYTFTTDNSITITNDNIHIMGEGWETKIKKDLVGTNIHDSAMFDINGEGCSIKSLELDYSTNTNDAASVGLIDMAGVTTSAGCLIRDVRFTGMNVGGDQHYLFSGDYVVVENCNFASDCATNVGRIWWTLGDESTFRDNIIESGSKFQIIIMTTTNNTGCRIMNNICYATLGYFVWLQNSDVEITGNKLFGKIDTKCIYLTAQTSSVPTDKINISDNVVVDLSNTYFVEYLAPNSGSDLDLNNFNISNNNLTESKLLSFSVTSTEDYTKTFTNLNVTGNTVSNTGGTETIYIKNGGASQTTDVIFENFLISDNNIESGSTNSVIYFHTDRQGSAGACIFTADNIIITDNNIKSSGNYGILFTFSDDCTATQLDVDINSVSITNNIIDMTNAAALDSLVFNFENNANLNSFEINNVDICNNIINNVGDGGIEITTTAGEPVLASNWSISDNIIDCNAGHGILWSSGQTTNVISNISINDNIIKPQLAESVEYGVQWYDNCERLEICRNIYEGKFVGIWVSASDNGSNAAEIYDLKVNENVIECLANTLGNPGIMIQTAAAGACDRIQCNQNKVVLTTTATGVYQKAIQFGEIGAAGDFTDVQILGNQLSIADTGGATARTHKPLYIAGDLIGFQINNNHINISATHADVSVFSMSIENPDSTTTKGTIIGNIIMHAMASPATEVGIYIAGANSIKTNIMGNSINLDDGTARYGVQFAGAATGFNCHPNTVFGHTSIYIYNGGVAAPAGGADFQSCFWFMDSADGTQDQVYICMQSDANAWNFISYVAGGA